MATDIFSTIKDLTLEKEDILEAELFAQQYLEDAFPSYDFRQGTALRDMTVRPNAVMLALVNKALRKYYDNSDILNMDDTTDSDLVDRKLSNFFIDRRTGTKTIINTRLYFTFPSGRSAALSIPSSAYFSPDGTHNYFPETNIAVLPDTETKSEKYSYFAYDSNESLWYVDVPMVAESPTEDYDIDEGELLYFTLFSPYFVKGTILNLVEKAIPTESNSKMLSRAYTAVSTRNLINTPSIVSGINDKFNFVKDVYVVGLGSDYLYRDLISINDVNDPEIIYDYHRGGMVDILVDTSTITTTIQLTTDTQGRIFLSGPVFGISRYSGPTNDTLDFAAEYTVSYENNSTYDANSVPDTPINDIGLSSRQRTVITFSGTDNTLTATFNIESFSGLNSIQTYLNSKDNRVVVADYLARSFEPAFIDISFNTHLAAPDTSTAAGKEVINEIKASVRKYIDSIDNGGTIYVSSVIEAIMASGFTDVVMPITVNSTLINRGLVSSTEAIVDSKTILPIQMFYLRNITVETLV